ncbi:glycoside hydrolase [Paenibacillus sp. HWE-109]|uniref:glycoside hydrolase n=1 Tax=Paenibacillus sp. HWE-109 TaxID=1306526 RepID=UPI001EE106A1|nr:glycoside hydrolase [Paenibacillus sp. HWE-109]UKS23835.1 glycoside hydrolase [Paenibacillus sp. HWE-109]
MKKQLTTLCVTSMLSLSLTGCWGSAATQPLPTISLQSTEPTAVKAAVEQFQFDVDPETFALVLMKNGVRMPASLPLPKAEVTNLVKSKHAVKWTYPNKVNVSIEQKSDYLDIRLESAGAEQFQWPSVQSDNYMLPLGEGKNIPASDANWREFLKDQTLSWSESFSMDFFALGKNQLSLVYVVTNKFNNEIHFDASPNVAFQFTHEFPSINSDKSYGFRLYVTANDPQNVVLPYKNYVAEQGKIVTLKEKAKLNPSISKLYGAPQIYLWSESILTDSDVKWPQLRSLLPKGLGSWLVKLLAPTTDGSAELEQVLKQISNQDFMDKYQKKVVLTALNQALKMREFYTQAQFPNPGEEARKLIGMGVDKLSEEKLYDLNKLLLKSILLDAVSELADWGQSDSTQLIKDMREAGIENAWLGLPNWSSGLMNPQMVSEGSKNGYLIAPYDSYHSIHEKGDPSWNTASFPDPTLYENATVTRKNNTKVAGFLQRGRKLNPTLAMPSVKQRVSGIMQDGISFNSWFVDCDATGEIYDDFSPAHPTTQQQDLQARLERLDYFATDKKMVVGSEGGNDFASSVIAFAQGIESPVIAWGDPDMRDQKNSPYYVGGYYAKDGIPERYGKPVPIKPLYEKVYIDPAYSVPLYKLIYNDTIITTNHWEWGSYKIKGEEADRMLYELLYNVPPLYHLDRKAWDKDKASMLGFLKVWSPFHREAVSRQMSGFSVLTEDRLVQSAQYGNDLKVIANFSDKQVTVAGEVISAKSAVLYNGKERQVFDAAANAKLL